MFQRRCSALLLPAFMVGIESSLSLQVATLDNHHAGGMGPWIMSCVKQTPWYVQHPLRRVVTFTSSRHRPLNSTSLEHRCLQLGSATSPYQSFV
uniref:Secreted protein n=1 Tax=Arundo donax TaxID=35708 RepID=A0A0A9EE08_ARUDO